MDIKCSQCFTIFLFISTYNILVKLFLTPYAHLASDVGCLVYIGLYSHQYLCFVFVCLEDFHETALIKRPLLDAHVISTIIMDWLQYVKNSFEYKIKFSRNIIIFMF